MKVDIYNAWEHLRIDEEDERRLLQAGLVKRTADDEWHFNETCFICRYWVYQQLEEGLVPLGERRHDPPVVMLDIRGVEALRGVWLRTQGHQFCGVIESRLSEQQLAERVARYRADWRELVGDPCKVVSLSQ